MTKLRLFLVLGVLVLAGTVGTSALAAGRGAICSGGTIAAGTYNSLYVSGNCVFAPGTITILGNLTVADGGILNDHAASPATVHVLGDVRVGHGAVLGLGKYGAPGTMSDTWVGGSIFADRPLTLYLGGMTVYGNVVSVGGGGVRGRVP